MARSVQDFINKAGVAANRIERLPAPPSQQVGPLITWAAFHLGGGFAAEAAVEQLQDPAGWKSLATILNVDSFDSLEAITFTLAATSTATALDLCSSAVFRLAGGTLRPNREFDLGSWRDAKKTAGLAPPTALGRWVRNVLKSQGWSQLEAARHQMVHRTTGRLIFLTAGSHRLPSSLYRVGTASHPVDTTVQSFVSFGRRRFDTFCAAVAKDFP